MTNSEWLQCIGELIGSLILTLGIIMAQYTTKSKSLGLDTKFKQRLFLGLAIMASVVIGISAAAGIGGSGYINPAIALMHTIAANKSWTIFIAKFGFEMIGGAIAGLLAIATIKMIQKANSEAPLLSEIFTLPAQSAIKTTGIEWLANIFWLLPIVCFLIGHGEVGGTATHALRMGDVFSIALAAGFAILFVILVIDEYGGANLNPQVWFGIFVGKLIVNLKGFTKQHVVNASLGLVNVMACGAVFGGIAYATQLLA